MLLELHRGHVRNLWKILSIVVTFSESICIKVMDEFIWWVASDVSFAGSAPNTYSEKRDNRVD